MYYYRKIMKNRLQNSRTILRYDLQNKSYLTGFIPDEIANAS